MSLLKLPLGPLERALVQSLQRLDPRADEVVLAAAALCCQVLGNGDVCLLLARWARQRPWGDSYTLPALANWRGQLAASDLVGAPGDFTPLILDGERLLQALAGEHYYLQYLIYLVALRRFLRQRLADFSNAQLGGAYYLFLRGMPEAGVYFARPSDALLDALDQLFEEARHVAA